MPLAHPLTRKILGTYLSDRSAACERCLTQSVGNGLDGDFDSFVCMTPAFPSMALCNRDRDELCDLWTLLFGHEADCAKPASIFSEQKALVRTNRRLQLPNARLNFQFPGSRMKALAANWIPPAGHGACKLLKAGTITSLCLAPGQ
jgi:hypothetical protein